MNTTNRMLLFHSWYIPVGFIGAVILYEALAAVNSYQGDYPIIDVLVCVSLFSVVYYVTFYIASARSITKSDNRSINSKKTMYLSIFLISAAAIVCDLALWLNTFYANLIRSL